MQALEVNVSLLDEARSLARHNGVNCTMQGVEPKLRAEIDEALEAGVAKTAIAAALKARGQDISASSLRRHARKECRCH